MHLGNAGWAGRMEVKKLIFKWKKGDFEIFSAETKTKLNMNLLKVVDDYAECGVALI